MEVAHIVFISILAVLVLALLVTIIVSAVGESSTNDKELPKKLFIPLDSYECSEQGTTGAICSSNALDNNDKLWRTIDAAEYQERSESDTRRFLKMTISNSDNSMVYLLNGSGYGEASFSPENASWIMSVENKPGYYAKMTPETINGSDYYTIEFLKN